jgi:hypothetical protein
MSYKNRIHDPVRCAMSGRALLKIAAASMLCGATAMGATTASAATDGLFIATPPQNDAPSYESNYGAEARLRGVGTSPEADARPGEYYFVLGAHAYRTRDYAHAIEMYQVAASWAFKPAEYNLGVMYARGQGVPVDMPRAMAWMALAAERNEPHYVDAREAIYAELTKEQFEQANVIWRQLKPTYGDDVALKRAKARWAEVRSHITGSRVGSVGNLQVGIPNANGGDPSSARAGSEAMKKAMQGQGVSYVRSTASTPAEATGGEGIDGSIAYRQLLESDNPYDPKFDSTAHGTAIVGPPTTVKPGAAPEPNDGKPEPPKQDQ